MAGIWDQMNTQRASPYAGEMSGGATIGSYFAGKPYDKKTTQLTSRMGDFLDTILGRLQDFGGNQTTTSNLSQSGATTQQQASKQTGAETASNLSNTINELMSSMSGFESGAQAGGSQQQQITDLINRVIGDKSDPRFASALARMAEQRKNVMGQFQQAEQPIAAKLDLYGEGGAYGQGAADQVRDATRQAMASGRTDLTRSGMASGSTMQGMKARFAGDEMTALRQIEDQRLGMLGGAQSELAGLRAGGAQTLAQMRDPAYSGFVGPTGTATTGTQSVTGATQGTSQTATGQQTAQTSEQMITSLLSKLMSGSQAGASSGTTSGSTSQQVTAPMQNVGQLLAAIM